MSDTMGIVLKVDASQAKPAVDAFEQSLAKVEARGPSVSAALTKAFRDGTTSAERLHAATANTATPFDGLTAALKREQDVLEKIQRPLKELHDGHEVLGSLLRQGKIDAEQYTEQLEKLEAAAGKAPKNAGEKFEGGIGFASGLLGGGVAAEAVEIGKSLAELAGESKRLADEYINLKNATLGFKEAGVSTDATVGEMRDLAEELHSKIPETTNLYRKLSENADHLGLTHEQLTEDVRAFGEAAIASGHTLDDAAGAVSRLSVAMQTGELDARALRSIIQTMPGIVKVWEAAFHESYDQIVHDIAEHRIGVRELMTATAQYGGVLKSTMDQHEKTNEMTKEEIIQGAKIFQQRHDVSFAEAMYAQKLNETELALAHNADGTLKYVDALTVFDKLMKQVNHDVDEVKSAQHQLAAEMGEAVAHGWGEARKAIDDTSTSVGNFMQASGSMEDKWGEVSGSLAQKAQRLTGAFGVGIKDAAKIGETKRELEELDKAYQLSGGHVLDYANRRKALLETLGGDEQKFYDGLVAPMQDYSRHLAELNDLHNRGAISVRLYEDELAKLQKSDPGFAMLEAAIKRDVLAYDQATAAAKRYREEREHGIASPAAGGVNRYDATNMDAVDLRNSAALDDLAMAKKDNASGAKGLSDGEKQWEKDYARATELYDHTRTAAEKYGDELKEINALTERGRLSDEHRSRILADLDVKYGKVYTQAEQYAKALQDLDARTKVGLVSLEAHDVELDKLRMKYNQGDLGTGFREGMRQIEASINPAMDAQKLLVDGFNGVRDSITSLVTTGTADFNKLVDSLLADAARMAEDQLLKDLFKIGSSGGGGGNDVINALGLMVPGAADGGYVNIPHFAGGGMLTPMRSGRDDHLLQMFVNTGERVTVQNQQQLAAEARGGGGGPVAVENHNHMTFQGLDDRSIAAGMASSHGQAATYKFIRDNAGAIRAILQRG